MPRSPVPPTTAAVSTVNRLAAWILSIGLTVSLTPCLADAPPPSSSPADHVTALLGPLGDWAPALFVALFVVVSVLCLPVVFLNLAAGALFGVPQGLLYAWIGAQIGATLAFHLSRTFAHQRIARILARRPMLAAVREAVSTEGWKVVLLLRLAPGSPFFLLNYLFGLTQIRFRDYFWATAISILPGTLFFVYLGSLGQKAAAGDLQSFWDWVLHAIGLVALFTAFFLVGRRAKAILRSQRVIGKESVREKRNH
ncbi:MAG: TVP38/TMEM64 family protein [Verrucomicrobiales bacterium]|nr:TVP38/TMEM64 family protein [Verrucomicrobiales bacterium]